MTWRREAFRAHYRETIGTARSSNSYVSYLNLVDELTAGLDERIAELGTEAALDMLGRQPDHGASYEALEIWEAPCDLVLARIAAPGGEARTERRSLAITQFKSIAEQVWPKPVP